MAADPIGEWRVANGNANIRIDNCNGALWGVISWEREPGGVDAQNPNPAERKRPTLGMPILLDMKPTRPGLWQGEVYNAENGKTYDFENQPCVRGRLANRGLRVGIPLRRRELDPGQGRRRRAGADGGNCCGRSTQRQTGAHSERLLRSRGGGP